MSFFVALFALTVLMVLMGDLIGFIMAGVLALCCLVVIFFPSGFDSGARAARKVKSRTSLRPFGSRDKKLRQRTPSPALPAVGPHGGERSLPARAIAFASRGFSRSPEKTPLNAPGACSLPPRGV
jgi:hypothetical protein